MQMILYKISDSKNTLNKTLEDGLTININLKSNTDIVRPDILLSDIEAGYNYFHLPELDRYYFIERVEQINNRLVKLSCKIDVLMTYKNEILSSNARFRRNIKTGDYIDTVIERSHLTQIKTFESGVTLTDPVNILVTVGG